MDFEGLNYVTPKLARKNLSAIKENKQYETMGYSTPPTQRRATNLSRRASSESFASNSSSEP